jgi:hypothetical protein
MDFETHPGKKLAEYAALAEIVAAILRTVGNGEGPASMITSRSSSVWPVPHLRLHDCARNATTVSPLLEGRAQ